MATWQDLKQRLGRQLDTGLLGTYTLVRPRRYDGRGWPPAPRGTGPSRDHHHSR